MATKKIPFEFVLERLMPLNPLVKPMFGCHAVYVGDKIMLILRLREDHPESNGVWIATSEVHHESLKRLFIDMMSIGVLSNNGKATDWQMIPYESDEFEKDVNAVCDLILKSDPRVGRVPKARKRKTAK
jgi:hypothetical protein